VHDFNTCMLVLVPEEHKIRGL
jgi:hypothetical protein